MQQIEAHGDQGKQVMVMSYTLELANRSQVSNGAIGDRSPIVQRISPPRATKIR